MKGSELFARRRIFLLLGESPGLHFREIQRKLDLATGELQYHLGVMVRSGLITMRRGSRYARYFPKDDFGAAESSIMSFLRQELPRGIVIFLLDKGPSCRTELQSSFDVSAPTLTYHLSKMLDAGVLRKVAEDVKTVFELVAPEKTAELLVTYRRSFFDALVDAFVASWTSRRT